MPAAHQPIAHSASSPTGMPSSSSRIVSAIGVTGWCSATQERPPGIESAGTNALDTYGAKAATNVHALAASTLLASRPKHAASHEIAVITASSSPATASQSSGPAPGRKPAINATQITSTVETTLRATLAAT